MFFVSECRDNMHLLNHKVYGDKQYEINCTFSASKIIVIMQTITHKNTADCYVKNTADCYVKKGLQTACCLLL